jgi:hypothetical protein
MTGNLIKNGGHPHTAPLIGAAVSAPQHPEYFRLPKSGGDRHFGFTRSFYYEGENRGYWRLVRIRERGKVRGITLVPYDSVAAFIRKQIDSGTDEESRE